MYNWNTSLTRLKKDSDSYNKWKLEQLINFGLGKNKIDLKLLKKYFPLLDIDQRKKEFLKFLLWPSHT
ncbi:MAG: hypothetical protein ABIB61_01075 [Candidatus Shapirobacteria bacterium]